MRACWAPVSVLALLLAGCASNGQPAAGDPARLPTSQPGRVTIAAGSPKLNYIRVEPVRTAEVPVDVVEAPGKVEVNPNRVSHVLLPVPGRIVAVHVRLGDAVKESEPLVTIESPEADAAMSAHLQAQAALAQARAALLKAQADYERSSDLYQHSAIARKEVLSAENALAQAKAAVEQAQASVQQALRRLQILGLQPGQFGQRIQVRAPVSGKVLEISVVPGEYRNDTNAALMTIADLSTVWVSSDVPESAIRFIQPGERVDIELAAYPGEVFRGRVMRIADTVDPQTRTVKVLAELNNSRSRLRPEMFGRIRHAESTRLLPVVPAGAVVQGDGQATVFKEVSRGVFDAVLVKPGRPVGSLIPILEGLRPGDRIVVDGVMLLTGS